MVKKITFLFVLFMSTISSFAQCVENAASFGNNTNIPSYNVSGDVSVIVSKNKLTLKTGDNYSTASGPDVRVYLVNSEGKTNQELITTDVRLMPNIPFGLVTFAGSQEITIDVPGEVDLKNYDTIYFYCFQFSQFWDFGKITPIDVSMCDNLSFSNLQQTNSFEISPNPVRDVLNIQGDLSEINEYKIYNSLGKISIHSKLINNKIDISKLARGVYSLVFLSNTTYESKKIIKL